jgi:hypothetical protein
MGWSQGSPKTVALYTQMRLISWNARIFYLHAAQFLMVEVYRKGDYKKPDRRKQARPEDRRVHPRFVFFADCVLIDSEGQRYDTRVTEISMGGCYVDSRAAFPRNSNVEIRFTKDGLSFTAEGRVLYTVPSVGSGIVFVSMSPENRTLLERWIDNLAR